VFLSGRYIKPRTVRNNHPLRPADRPFGTYFLVGAKGQHSQVVRLAFRICHLEVAVTGQNVAWRNHRMWDLRGQGEVQTMGAETAQKSDHPAESAVLSSRCRDSHSYGHHNGRHCCGGGFDDGLGRGHYYARDHVFVRHLGPCGRDYGRRVLVVHGRHCILRPCYAFGSGLCSGHGAGRQVETEDEYPRREEGENLWVRGPYVKDERKPLVAKMG
jgi:hypothetical protein